MFQWSRDRSNSRVNIGNEHRRKWKKRFSKRETAPSTPKAEAHMVLKLSPCPLANQSAQELRERLLSSTSLLPSAPELQLPEAGAMVTMENVFTVERAHMLVQTTQEYRRDLVDVPDPAQSYCGIIVKIADSDNQCASRVDVLWQNGWVLQGYRVGFAGTSNSEPSFDLEISEPGMADSERLFSAWEMHNKQSVFQARDETSTNGSARVGDTISTQGEEVLHDVVKTPWRAIARKFFTRVKSSPTA